MVQHEPDQPVPLYDLDEIIAALDREEAVPVFDLDEIIASLSLEDSSPASVPTGITPTTPPPRYSVLPSIPTAIPAPSTPPSTSRTTYSFHSPGHSGVSNDWSEAGAATQGSPRSHVRAIRRSRMRRPSPQAYTVFRGLATGVFESWEEVEPLTSGVRFALQQGYATRAQAEEAYQVAVARGWTCDSAACVECALNVLGIQRSRDEKVATYAEALEKFDRAQRRGEVEVQRIRSCI
ncbi:hypothetical protein B0H14DRAFT_2614231 [Mycena olivaceomarginata]|nr:hypothetical protein B0H14DRAFT_2614231 [Mycena olivaceomarginata]